MAFPATRLRRLRQTGVLRGLVRETELAVSHLVYPMFVVATRPERARRSPRCRASTTSRSTARSRRPGSRTRSASPPCCCSACPRARTPRAPARGTTRASSSSPRGRSRPLIPDLLVITDLCLCEYTSHGHCGVLRPDGVVDNDQTLELLARTAVSQAEAGADAVAPSDMMDGRVGALRAALDDHGLTETPIIAYSAKFASAFYGPFREAADSAPQSRATARATRWIRPTRSRPCARPSSTPTRAPTSSWSSPRCRTWTSSGASRTPPACPSPPTTSAASTRWSRRPPRRACSTSAPPCSRRSPASAAPAPTS